MTDRLDRIEQLLEASIAASNDRFTRIEASIADVAAQQQVNTQTIAASNQRLDRIEAMVNANTQSIDRLTTDIGGLALQIEQMIQEARQDRSQATIDRAEFRSTVQNILDTWTQRFNSNGHSNP